MNHFRLSQIVKVPTRKNATLDLVLTNLKLHYENPQAFPTFGLSDHNVILTSPKAREKAANMTKTVLRRDLRPSRKEKLGRYLSSVDWQVLFTGLQSCEELFGAFHEVLCTGLDLLMPVKRVRINTGDAPCITKFILKRQQAFHKHGSDSVQFKFYGNAVNRKRKHSKAKFYKTKIDQMKQKDPRSWWKEVKRLSGAQQFSSSNLISLLDISELEGLSKREVGDHINCALLQPLEEYRLTEKIPRLPLENQSPKYLVVTEYDVYKKLSHLNAAKAGGPDGVPNWILREYAELLAYPVATIRNASFKEQKLPRAWKLADVTFLPRTKPVKEIKKQLRPISLTPSISKIAEEFVVTGHVKPAVLRILDPSQFGAIPKSSTTFALLEMVHEWSQGTEGNGSTIRSLFF